MALSESPFRLEHFTHFPGITPIFMQVLRNSTCGSRLQRLHGRCFRGDTGFCLSCIR